MKKRVMATISLLTVFPIMVWTKVELLTVNRLAEKVFNKTLIEKILKEQVNIQLDPDEIVKTKESEEGKDVKVETFDDFVIDTPIQLAVGCWNKGRC